MDSESSHSSAARTGRRTLLRRGLALVGGIAAVGGGALTKRAMAAPAPSPGRTLTVYARKRPVAGDAGARVLASGDLLDVPGGRSIGQFHASAFCVPTAMGPAPVAGSTLEFHVLQFTDGSLFGMRGGTLDGRGSSPVAVIGGTARFAGASGTFIERPAGAGAREHDLVELLVTFTS